MVTLDGPVPAFTANDDPFEETVAFAAADFSAATGTVSGSSEGACWRSC
jgi:hypothetical protein